MKLKPRSPGPLPSYADIHPALAPLIDTGRTGSREVGAAMGAVSDEVGRVDVYPHCTRKAGQVGEAGQVGLRYNLELAWLGALDGPSLAAASILAARTAGFFAAMPGVILALADLPPVFASLTTSTFDAKVAAEAALALADTHAGTDKLTSADLACIEALWPLAVPTECLLASGGDDRLSLHPQTGLNRYGCAPWPRIEMIAFGSCTASSLSQDAFAAAERARQSLIEASLQTAPSVALAAASDDIGAALLDHFGVADLAEAVLAASGTDAALVVTGLLAAERPGEVFTSVLMSPAETGSGVPDAVQGRHFASSAAAGCKVGKGQPIDGLPFGPRLVTVSLRNEAGTARSQFDIASDCRAAIQAGLAHGRVVLHAIDGSKTGLTAPDRETCRRLAAEFADGLDIVVDACQARIEPTLVRWYLEHGFPVLMTGSKFFAAPGFCGVVLFPRSRLGSIARDGRLPAGLAPYARLEGGFGSRRCPGLVLRWCAALHQMRAFAALPPAVTARRLARAGAFVEAAIRRDRRLGLVDATRPAGTDWSGHRSVFTFRARVADQWLSASALRPLYEALALDLAPEARPEEQEAVAARCQIGQPVELGVSGCGGLRIAISAAQLVEDGELQSQLGVLGNKLAVLLDDMQAGGPLVRPAAVGAAGVPAASRVLLTG